MAKDRSKKINEPSTRMLNKIIRSKDILIAEKDALIKEKTVTIREKASTIKEKSGVIKDKNALIAELRAKIEKKTKLADELAATIRSREKAFEFSKRVCELANELGTSTDNC